MIQFVVAVGLAWWLMRKGDDVIVDDDTPTTPPPTPWIDPNIGPDGNCNDGYVFNSEGVCAPYIEPEELEPSANWSIEYTVPGYSEMVVWQLDVDDHSSMPDGAFIVIGNLLHTGFLAASVSGGTILIKKEVSGGDVDRANVIVYSDIATASERLDRLAAEATPDEDDDEGGDVFIVPEFVEDKTDFTNLSTHSFTGV